MNIQLQLSYMESGAKKHLDLSCNHAKNRGFDPDSVALLAKAISDLEEIRQMALDEDKKLHPYLYKDYKEGV